MSRRIDIEITSLSGESATWRAAGAKLPKGVVSTALLGGNVTVGQIYRAEIDQFMEGVEVLSVTPPRQASPLDPRNERVVLIPKEHSGPDVQVTYAPKGRGGRGRDDDRGGRERSKDGDRKPRDKAGPRGDRPARSDSPRTEGSERPAGRDGRPARASGPREAGRSNGSARRDARPARGERTFEAPVATIYRNAFLATLSPEQIPVAEQLLRGGMPAVRNAIEEQNRTATAQGRPTINADVIVRIADELLSKTLLSGWKDRAAGAIGAGKELRVRDLRAVVTSAKTVMLDDEGRAQLKELQTTLGVRVEALRVEWIAKFAAALAGDNVLEALRLASKTPDVSTKVSAEDATKLIAITSSALSEDAIPVRWIEIVNVAVESPIRRQIKPSGIPVDDACKALAIKSAGSIPEFAKLLGMKVPPPPPPLARPARRPATTRRS